MAFTPVDLPIQEILQTDFITDIGVISNSNALILKDKLEDLLNNFEIDTNTISIGTDNAINYIKTQNVIMQDGGFVFQTGSPNQIIAKLEKNTGSQSVLNVDIINIDSSLSTDILTANSLTLNSSLTSNGPATFNAPVELKSAFVTSKETIVYLLEKNGAAAETRIVLTSTSKNEIFLKLQAETNIGATQVYDGVSSIVPGITDFIVYFDFDVNSPPAQNAVFTVHLVDVVSNTTGLSISNAVTLGGIPIKFKAGTNLNSAAPIKMHYDLDAEGVSVGIQPSSPIYKYGSSISLLYILDENTIDRLIIKNLVGMEIF